jgi:prepilin-type processing-associated H-X9-DG protein
MVRYSYYTETNGLRPMPTAAALSRYLGVRTVRADNKTNMSADIDAGVLRKLFTCPTDINNLDSTLQGAQINAGVGAGFHQVLAWNSYFHNAELFGWADLGGPGGSVDHSRARGKLSTMRRTSETMSMCDGAPSASPFGGGLYEVYGAYRSNTLAEAYLGINGAGNSGSFSLKRHRGRINVLYLDGHVDNHIISAKGLSQVLLAADLR